MCEYHPPGNVLGQFEENVRERVSDEGGDAPTATATATGTATPQGGASVLGAAGGSVGALWVAILVAGVVIV